jgi:amidophosphoribosyltransferase
MCGILGVVGQSPVNQLLYDGLQVLQHRGQDAAGIVTSSGKTFHMHKGSGMVRDVFRTRNMRSLMGNAGIAHVRYPTAGSASSLAEAQPFYVNSPFGIVLAHNGNLTNTDELKADMFRHDLRHINTNSDSEVLLNVFAHELAERVVGFELSVDAIFGAIEAVHRRVRGAYAVVALIAGYGLVAFRDPNGIRPLVIGSTQGNGKAEYMFASESVALDCSGFSTLRDVEPGEGVFVSFDGDFHARQCAKEVRHAPCLFEYVYFARPDSVIDGASVYQSRIVMGRSWARKSAACCRNWISTW